MIKYLIDTILLNSPVKKRTIRIYILWNDDETSQEMSDDEDTNSTKSEKIFCGMMMKQVRKCQMMKIQTQLNLKKIHYFM